MFRPSAGIALLALTAGFAFGQLADAPPAFDLADVHASAPTTNPFARGGVMRGGRYEVRTATLVDLIRMAYNVDADKVVGGPSWLETDRFDVIAKAPAATTAETARLMLQRLLADRFKLVVHTDTKPLSVFVLSLGKGKPKLKEADGSGNGGCQGVPQNPQPGTIPNAIVNCRNVPMELFAQTLRQMAGAYITAPVIDQTGLKGSWDFTLEWTARALLTYAGDHAITLFDAVDKQLGLKLEPKTTPTPVIVVDSVNRKPTDNPPGVTQNMPPAPPAEFDVADIKPSPPDATQPRGQIQNGRVNVEAFPLKLLIMIAWNINNDDELVAGMPKWAESARFNIVAKVSAGDGPRPDVDIDALRLMLQKLLVDRFQMKIHMENRPVTAYTLVAVKPKLKKADPSNRSGCKEGPMPGTKDPRDVNPALSRLVTCLNTTMAQFAEQLPSLANGYTPTPVVDKTELEGAWDFSVNFSPAGLLMGLPGRGGEGNPQQAASDPSGALSLFDAVSKQLGLKLEKEKRPLPVLVIDHIEEKPTDN